MGRVWMFERDEAAVGGATPVDRGPLRRTPSGGNGGVLDVLEREGQDGLDRREQQAGLPCL